MGWIAGVVQVLFSIIKSVFGTDKPAKTTVVHPDPEVEITDGKTDTDRLNDLGL